MRESARIGKVIKSNILQFDGGERDDWLHGLIELIVDYNINGICVGRKLGWQMLKWRVDRWHI